MEEIEELNQKTRDLTQQLQQKQQELTHKTQDLAQQNQQLRQEKQKLEEVLKREREEWKRERLALTKAKEVIPSAAKSGEEISSEPKGEQQDINDTQHLMTLLKFNCIKSKGILRREAADMVRIIARAAELSQDRSDPDQADVIDASNSALPEGGCLIADRALNVFIWILADTLCIFEYEEVLEVEMRTFGELTIILNEGSGITSSMRIVPIRELSKPNQKQAPIWAFRHLKDKVQRH